MIEILLLALAMLVMAKKRRRKMGRYIRGNVDDEFDTSVIAGRTVVSNAFDDAVNERTYVSSIRATYTLSNVTEGFSIGPFTVGVAHSDYSAGEIEVWLENSGQWDEGNQISQEIAKRKIRTVGTFESADIALQKVTLNNGRPITTKLGWILLQGQTLQVWVYNSGSNTTATTAPELITTGHCNLWPR